MPEKKYYEPFPKALEHVHSITAYDFTVYNTNYKGSAEDLNEWTPAQSKLKFKFVKEENA